MRFLAILLVEFLSGAFTSYGQVPMSIILHGKILNQKTHGMVDATVDIFCNNDFLSCFSGENLHGEYTAPFKDFGWYIISISAPGYLPKTDTLWVLNEKRSSIERDFYITPVEAGLTITINNIYFEFGKAQLTGSSLPELDKMVDFFTENPNISFEIGGHTDRNGAEDYNLYLSQARAQSVVDYLVSRGVGRSRLTAKGYGKSMPLDNSETPEADVKNRRVEFKVLDTPTSIEN